MRRNRAELHSLAGAYALDALSAADYSRFGRHLAGCERVRRHEQVGRHLPQRPACRRWQSSDPVSKGFPQE